MILKASIPGVQTTFHQSHDLRILCCICCRFNSFKEAFRRPEGPTLFPRLRLKKEPPSAGISNIEQGTPNVEGRSPSGK